MSQAGLEASSFRAHMRNEMTAQLYVRLTTNNWDESVAARAEGAQARLQGLSPPRPRVFRSSR